MNDFFGNFGDKVRIKNHLSRRNTQIGTIVVNQLDSDGRIKVHFDDLKCGESEYAYHQYCELISDSKDNVNSWQFQSVSILDLDFERIYQSTSKTNPILLIDRGDRKFVAIHKSLIEKSNVVTVTKPDFKLEIYPNVIEIEQQFSVWIDWAKKVKAARWPCKVRNRQLVNIRVVII